MPTFSVLKGEKKKGTILISLILVCVHCIKKPFKSTRNEGQFICGIRAGQGKVWSFEASLAGLCGVALGPLFGYPVVLCSVGQVLCGDASHQRVSCGEEDKKKCR